MDWRLEVQGPLAFCRDTSWIMLGDKLTCSQAYAERTKHKTSLDLGKPALIHESKASLTQELNQSCGKDINSSYWSNNPLNVSCPNTATVVIKFQWVVEPIFKQQDSP